MLHFELLLDVQVGYILDVGDKICRWQLQGVCYSFGHGRHQRPPYIGI